MTDKSVSPTLTPLTLIPSTRLIPKILEREDTLCSLLTRFDESKLDVLVLLLVLLPIIGDVCAKAKLVKHVDIISANKDKEPRINNVFSFIIL